MMQQERADPHRKMTKLLFVRKSVQTFSGNFWRNVWKCRIQLEGIFNVLKSCKDQKDA